MPWIISLLLSMIAGYVDTAAFVQFTGLFAAHVTGNFVLFAVALGAGPSETDFLKLVSFPVFIAAIFVTTWLHDLAPGSSGERRSRLLLWAVSLMLLAVGFTALLPFLGISSVPNERLAQYGLALAMVAAMGVQNAVHRLYAHFGPATTVMTGNVAQLTVNALRRLTGWADATAKTPPGQSFRELLWLVVGFAVGCGLAVPLTHWVGLVAILLPGAVLATALLGKGRVPGH
jgi:uncharacterized membrane protein YoaK (UPF0700 family)